MAHPSHTRLPVLDRGLFETAQKGDVPEAGRLIGRRANVNATDGYKQTPLHYAAWKGQLSIAELLTTKGAKVDIADKYKNTPLHYAAACGHLPVVELLITKGADAHAQDKGRKTPLDYAKRGKRSDCVAFLQALRTEDHLLHKSTSGAATSSEPDAAEDEATSFAEPLLLCLEEAVFTDEVQTAVASFVANNLNLFQDITEEQLTMPGQEGNDQQLKWFEAYQAYAALMEGLVLSTCVASNAQVPGNDILAALSSIAEAPACDESAAARVWTMSLLGMFEYGNFLAMMKENVRRQREGLPLSCEHYSGRV